MITNLLPSRKSKKITCKSGFSFERKYQSSSYFSLSESLASLMRGRPPETGQSQDFHQTSVSSHIIILNTGQFNVVLRDTGTDKIQVNLQHLHVTWAPRGSPDLLPLHQTAQSSPTLVSLSRFYLVAFSYSFIMGIIHLPMVMDQPTPLQLVCCMYVSMATGARQGHYDRKTSRQVLIFNF